MARASLSHRALRVGFAALLATGLPARLAFAEASAQDVALAETLFQDAKRLMAAQSYAEACPKFAESNRLDPAPGTVLNLAVCYDQAGQTASAWVTYSEALILAQRENREDRVATIQERLTALDARLSKVTVNVAEARDGLTVEIDSTPVRSAAWSVATPINPGKHQLRARAPGFEDYVFDFDVPQEKGDVTITVPALVPAKVAPVAKTPASEAGAAPSPNTPDQAASDGSAKRTTGLIVGGVGIALVGVGGYFGVKALQQKTESDDACPDDHCSAEGAQKSEDANFSANIANVGIGVGLVAIGVGTYFFVTGSRERAESVARRTLVVPMVSSHSGGLVFRTSL